MLNDTDEVIWKKFFVFGKILGKVKNLNKKRRSLKMGNNKDNIKVLPETIRKNGFSYILLTRTPKKALYAQYCENVLIGWEVFQIRVRGMHFSQFLSKQLKPTERFPGNSDFGKTAWSIQNYQDALKKYQEL